MEAARVINSCSCHSDVLHVLSSSESWRAAKEHKVCCAMSATAIRPAVCRGSVGSVIVFQGVFG